MKKVLLTGLGSEQKFNYTDDDACQEKLGETEYHLIFNEGELRVRVGEQEAHKVVQYMFKVGEEEEEVPGKYNGQSFSNLVVAEDGTDEDGIDQI